MNKYNAKRTVYNGITFDSQKEARYCAYLDLLKKATDVTERVESYERQVRYDIIVNDCKIGFYKLDFKVKYCNGTIEHVDIKGIPTPVYKIKKKLVEAIYGIKIIEK